MLRRGFWYDRIKAAEEGGKLNIQIFGRPKCFDTKKAERYFKERRIKFQKIDLTQKGMSRGEFQSVKAALGGITAMIGEAKDPDAVLLGYLAREEDREQKLFENQKLLKTPIVRNGREATAGYCPEVWKNWK